MVNFSFNEELHQYKINGIEIPSVSRVLSEARLSDMSMVPDHVLKTSSEFGKAVHKVIELYCQSKLDFSNLSPPLIPYVEGWKNFVEDFGYKFKRAEIRGYHPFYMYGFTIDTEGEITKGKYIGDVIGDIKSGVPMPSHKYQLNGAYKLALPKRNTFILYLDPEFHRGYKILFGNNNKREQNVFLAALTIFNIRKEEGLI